MTAPLEVLIVKGHAESVERIAEALRAVLAVLNAYSWIAAAAIVLWAVYILFGMK